MGIASDPAEAARGDLIERVAKHAPTLRLPAFARRSAKSLREALLAIIEARARSLR